MKNLKLIFLIFLLYGQMIKSPEEEFFQDPTNGTDGPKLTFENVAEHERITEERNRPKSTQSTPSSRPETTVGPSSGKQDTFSDMPKEEKSDKTQLKLDFKKTKIQLRADAAHQDIRFFKDTLIKKYIDRAEKLEKNVKGLLTNAKFIDGLKDSYSIQLYIDDLNKAINNEKELLNLWIFGKRSNALIEDLSQLKQTLTDQLNHLNHAQRSTEIAAGEKVYARSKNVIEADAKKITRDAEKQIAQAAAEEAKEDSRRTTNIDRAKPATASDYVGKSFTTIEPDSGTTTLHTDYVKDEKSKVLRDELAKLKNSLTFISNENSDQYKNIEEKIKNLKEQLTEHHTNLLTKTEKLSKDNEKQARNIEQELKKTTALIEQELKNMTQIKSEQPRIEAAENILKNLLTKQNQLKDMDKNIARQIYDITFTQERIKQLKQELQSLPEQIANVKKLSINTETKQQIATLQAKMSSDQTELSKAKVLIASDFEKLQATETKRENFIKTNQITVKSLDSQIEKAAADIKNLSNIDSKNQKNQQESQANINRLTNLKKDLDAQYITNQALQAKILALIGYHANLVRTGS